MQTEINPLSAADWIRDHATEIAKARSERSYLEEYRKTLKAKLMNKAQQENISSLGAQEAYAYSHPDYELLLKGYAEAVENYERLRWMMVAAQAKIDIWRSFESSRRSEMSL